MYLFNKSSLLLILGSFLVFHISYAQRSDDKGDDRIFWSARQKLTFGDFQGSPDSADTALHHLSATSLSHHLGSIVSAIVVYPSKEQAKTTFAIYAVMNKNKSWIIHKNEKELSHEQGSFDICEIYARILRRGIKQTKTVAEARDLYDKITADEAGEQKRYDKENTYENGGITTEWKEKLAARLKELELFSRPIVIMPYNK